MSALSSDRSKSSASRLRFPCLILAGAKAVELDLMELFRAAGIRGRIRGHSLKSFNVAM